MKYQKVCKLMIFFCAMLQVGALIAIPPTPAERAGEGLAATRRVRVQQPNRRLDQRARDAAQREALVAAEDARRAEARAQEDARMDEIMHRHSGLRRYLSQSRLYRDLVENPDIVTLGHPNTPVPPLYRLARRDEGHDDMRWFRQLLAAGDRPHALMLLGNALRNGFDVNARDPLTGRTPLTHALDLGRLREAQMLLQAGADVNQRGIGGMLPIQFALRVGDESGNLVALLLERGVIVPQLLRGDPVIRDISTAMLVVALEMGEGDVHKALQAISQGADVNRASGAIKNTPLHIAAMRGNAPLVEELIDNGAIVNIGNASEQTPFWMAAWWGHTNVMSILIKKGADINKGAQTLHGEVETPLMVAREHGHSGAVELLRQCGARE